MQTNGKNLTNNQIRILNIGKSGLENDPVYSSLPDGNELKYAMETRNLHGKSVSDFVREYHNVLDKIKAKEKSQQALVSYQSTGIPAKIDTRIIAASKHKEKYLLSLCEEYNWNQDNLETAVELCSKQKTNLHAIAKLHSYGWSFEDIESLLTVRDSFNGEGLSLKQLGRFARQFCSGDSVDSDELYELVLQVKESQSKNYLSTRIAYCIEFAKQNDAANLESVLDAIENNLSNSPESIISSMRE